MSTFEIKMPKLGESITEGTIMRWAVNVGDTVREDDILFEVSTAKVNAEIPSPVAGKVLELRFAENETVSVGVVVVVIETESDDNTAQPADTAVDTKPSPRIPPEAETSSAASDDRAGLSGKKERSDRFYSPLVRNIARAENITDAELDTVRGTGFGGRVSKTDVLQYLEQRKKASPQFSSEAKAAQAHAGSDSRSPKEAGGGASDDTTVEMDRVRRIIADHMVMSKSVAAHVTTFVDADVTKLVRWRERTKDEFFRREGVKLTYMPVIVEACAKALIDFPQVNASVDGHNIILKKRINIGVAVALDDGNLIVPVIHDADKMNVNGLAVAVDTLAAKARSNKLAPDDIQGGTFTITNFGTFRNIFGTPIIHQPQSAILGAGYVEKRPAVVETPEGDMIAVRHKMYLSLSYDHRNIDGALGGAFLRKVADYLENYA